MNMNRKGMTIGMVFIFIVAAVTFALIMIFGYKMITDFMAKGGEVEFFQFKSDLETSVKKIYTEYGSVRMEEYSLPMEFERICFVDLGMDCPEDCNFDAYACDVWKDAGDYEGADENVFLKPLSEIAIKVYKIELYENDEKKGYLCFDIVKGRFKLRLEGRGDRTRLSEG